MDVCPSQTLTFHCPCSPEASAVSAPCSSPLSSIQGEGWSVECPEPPLVWPLPQFPHLLTWINDACSPDPEDEALGRSRRRKSPVLALPARGAFFVRCPWALPLGSPASARPSLSLPLPPLPLPAPTPPLLARPRSLALQQPFFPRCPATPSPPRGPSAPPAAAAAVPARPGPAAARAVSAQPGARLEPRARSPEPDRGLGEKPTDRRPQPGEGCSGARGSRLSP